MKQLTMLAVLAGVLWGLWGQAGPAGRASNLTIKRQETGAVAQGVEEAVHDLGVSVKSFGATADSRTALDGTITAGSHTLTCSCAFTAGDVGRQISVWGAGDWTPSVDNRMLVTSIASVTNPTTVVLDAAAVTAVPFTGRNGGVFYGVVWVIGTDNTTAIQDALNSGGITEVFVPPAPPGHGYAAGELRVPIGVSVVGQSNVSSRMVYIGAKGGSFFRLQGAATNDRSWSIRTVALEDASQGALAVDLYDTWYADVSRCRITRFGTAISGNGDITGPDGAFFNSIAGNILQWNLYGIISDTGGLQDSEIRLNVIGRSFIGIYLNEGAQANVVSKNVISGYELYYSADPQEAYGIYDLGAHNLLTENRVEDGFGPLRGQTFYGIRLRGAIGQGMVVQNQYNLFAATGTVYPLFYSGVEEVVNEPMLGIYQWPAYNSEPEMGRLRLSRGLTTEGGRSGRSVFNADQPMHMETSIWPGNSDDFGVFENTNGNLFFGLARAKAGGNVGNMTLAMDATPLARGVEAGTYTLICTDASGNGTFTLTAPDAVVLGTVAARPYAAIETLTVDVSPDFSGEVRFDIYAGTTPFVLGDQINIIVYTAQANHWAVAEQDMTSAALEGNTGNGIVWLGWPSAHKSPIPGIYYVRYESGTTFGIEDPDGQFLGEVDLGASWRNQVALSLTAGSISPAVGDWFEVVVKEGTYAWRTYHHTDGSWELTATTAGVEKSVMRWDRGTGMPHPASLTYSEVVAITSGGGQGPIWCSDCAEPFAGGGSGAWVFGGSSGWIALAGTETLTFSAPLNKSGTTVSIPAATSAVDGYLTRGDWAAFSEKIGDGVAAHVGYPSVGKSGADYDLFGFNVAFSITTGAYTYRAADTASAVRFNTGRITFLSAPSGAAGAAITWTEDGYVDATGLHGTIAPGSVGTPGTYTKVTTDTQGRVTAGAGATASDISGLGGAALLSVGTTAGTVAAGDDPRFDAAHKAPSLAAYANNAAAVAGGLTVGQLYRTGADPDVVCVVH